MKKQKCPYMWAFSLSGELVAVTCGLWDCPHCGKLNANMWAARVSLHLETRAHPAYFWTLTMRGKYKTKEQAYEALPKLWNTLRMRVQRFYLEVWEYCAFVEGQPRRKQMPHFHVISMLEAPERIKDFAMEIGFGYQAKEEVINSMRAALYVSKYTSKGDKSMPKNFRRCRVSKTWVKLPKNRRRPLIVKSRNETLTHYLTRVHDETGKPLEELYNSWSNKVSSTVP